MTGLREAQQEQTRQAILDAYLELAHDDSAVNVSVPAVAEKAGVSVRTVYRYFPSKEELQAGAAYRLTEEAQRKVAPIQSVNRSNLQAFLTQAWFDFAEQIPAVTAEHCTAAGRQLRLTRLADAREIAAKNLPPGGQDAETVDMLVALMSSSIFLELVDRMGHPPDRAATMASRMCLLLVDDVAKDSDGHGQSGEHNQQRAIADREAN